MKTAKYIDTHSHETMHEQFNASLLLMCSMVFDKVEYLCGHSSYKRIEKLIGKSNQNPTNIEHRRIWVLSGGTSRLANVLRLFISALQNIRLVLFAGSKEVLIFNYNNLFSLFTVNFICKILHRRVVIFCHGEMEFILKQNSGGGIIVRSQRWLACKFFLSLNRRSNLYFAVMGDSILRNIGCVIGADLHLRFISVDHSYIFGQTTANLVKQKSLQVGTVGVMNHQKGYDMLCELAGKLSSTHNVELSVTGRIFGDVQRLSDLGIDIPSNNGLVPIDGDEFSERIERLNYILFLYPTYSYKMIASGAIMDSIDKARPIISLRNDYFDYLFDKYGAFGYMASTIDEIVEIIEGICDGKTESQNYDFDRLRAKLSPENISVELDKALHKIGYL